MTLCLPTGAPWCGRHVLSYLTYDRRTHSAKSICAIFSQISHRYFLIQHTRARRRYAARGTRRISSFSYLLHPVPRPLLSLSPHRFYHPLFQLFRPWQQTTINRAPKPPGNLPPHMRPEPLAGRYRKMARLRTPPRTVSTTRWQHRAAVLFSRSPPQQRGSSIPGICSTLPVTRIRWFNVIRRFAAFEQADQETKTGRWRGPRWHLPKH